MDEIIFGEELKCSSNNFEYYLGKNIEWVVENESKMCLEHYLALDSFRNLDHNSSFDFDQSCTLSVTDCSDPEWDFRPRSNSCEYTPFRNLHPMRQSRKYSANSSLGFVSSTDYTIDKSGDNHESDEAEIAKSIIQNQSKTIEVKSEQISMNSLPNLMTSKAQGSLNCHSECSESSLGSINKKFNEFTMGEKEALNFNSVENLKYLCTRMGYKVVASGEKGTTLPMQCVCKTHPQSRLEVHNYNQIKICKCCIQRLFDKLQRVDKDFIIKFDYPLWRYILYGQGGKNLKLTVHCRKDNHLVYSHCSLVSLLREDKIYVCPKCKEKAKDDLVQAQAKQMESVYIKETQMIDNLYSKYCSGLKNAEFYFGDRYRLDILSKQYDTVDEFLEDNSALVDRLKEINAAASVKAKDDKQKGKKRRQTNTEYMKQFALSKLELLSRELFIVECKMLGITYKKNYLDYLIYIHPEKNRKFGARKMYDKLQNIYKAVEYEE